MTLINSVVPITFKSNKTETESLERKPDITSKPDTVEISSKSEKGKQKKKRVKKVCLWIAGIDLAAAAAFLIYMVGRNPAKAAKVLHGTTKVKNTAYNEGISLAKEIFEKEGNFKTSLDDLMKIFQQPKYKTALSADIDALEKYIAENHIPADSDLAKATETLKQNLQKHISNVEQKLLQGEKVDYNLGEVFANENTTTLNTIQNALRKDNYTLSNSFDKFSVRGKITPNKYIFDCPPELLPDNGVFYHGTKNAKGIYEDGFTPYVSNQIEKFSREIGAGIYVTPDPRVAAYFSGLGGSIIPVKLTEGSKVAIVTEASFDELNQILSKFVSERMGTESYNGLSKEVQNAMGECIRQDLFKKAGYDAVYVPKGVKGGGGLFNIGAMLAPDINEVIGVKQSQLVVYNPEKIEIVSRDLGERIRDVKDKFSAFSSALKWQMDHPLGF